MSLLDVYVIFAYYNKAEKSDKNKITNQRFYNKFVIDKIIEIEQYHSSALHWNLNELQHSFPDIVRKAKTAYLKIENDTDIEIHDPKGITDFQNQIAKNIDEFMQFSRDKAQAAQSREIVTFQPKEQLETLSKARITISNYLGGKYYFTVDEVAVNNNNLYLIEDKNTDKTILPSKSDIKDGLLKMILYSNLKSVTVNNHDYNCTAILSLTSRRVKGQIDSTHSKKDLDIFIKNNSFTKNQI